MLYYKARFGRGLLGRGSGLGNRLFPWSRYRIFAEFNTGASIAPIWMRPAVGQLWRGGISYRDYLRQLVLFGLFRKRDDELGVIVGNLSAIGAVRVAEPMDPATAISTAAYPGRDVKVVFEGYERYFRPLNGWDEFLLRELRATAKSAYRNMADEWGEIPVGICVRCGNDFKAPEGDCARLKPGERTPVPWFTQSLALIRRVVGRPVRAFVVSDGTRHQLRELLEMEDVVFVRPGCAISDLLALARARVLLVSGSSSFCAWASFLGQMPSISHAGQPLADWGIEPRCGQYMGEFDPQNPDLTFLTQARQTLLLLT